MWQYKYWGGGEPFRNSCTLIIIVQPFWKLLKIYPVTQKFHPYVCIYPNKSAHILPISPKKSLLPINSTLGKLWHVHSGTGNSNKSKLSHN